MNSYYRAGGAGKGGGGGAGGGLGGSKQVLGGVDKPFSQGDVHPELAILLHLTVWNDY